MDYWHGYWIVVDRARDAHLNLSYITLHNLTYPRQVTIPVHDIGTYFIVISSAKWLGEEGNVAKYEDDWNRILVDKTTWPTPLLDLFESNKNKYYVI